MEYRWNNDELKMGLLWDDAGIFLLSTLIKNTLIKIYINI